MTYNIRHGLGTDNRIDLGRVAAVIASYEPDVVALQEVDAGLSRSGATDQADDLALRLGMHATFAPCMESDGGRYGIATLTRLPLVSSAQVALPRAGRPRRRSEPRCALVARMAWAPASDEDDRPPADVCLINTHLSVVRGERPAQVAALAALLEVDDLVIAGDFNCTPSSRTYRALCTGLRPTGSRAPSWPARWPLLQLDHVLYRGGLRVASAGVWTTDDARRASDHLPVVAAFEAVAGGQP